MKTTLSVALLALLPTSTTSCAGGASSGGARGPLTNARGDELVTFRLVDVMISPTRLDGKPWDSVAHIDDPGARDRIVTAMNHASNAKGAYDAASTAMSHLGNEWGGLPDVGGTASVDVGDGKMQTYSFDGEKDSLTPHFDTRWEHVPLSHWTTVRMYFVDRETTGKSDIGAVVLSPLDLAAALEKNGRAHHVRVDDQTNGQILFVGIAVKAEHES
jgi:hypothetical protein